MYTYILIDDEQLIRKGTIKKLQPLDHLISCIGEAENGAAGISLIQELHPDFVILDMQMPCMDGTELLPYLAEHYPGMPLIVISGFRDFDYIKHAISADAVDYLLKPFSKDAICDCVHRVIERLENSQSISRQLSDSKEQKEAAYYECDLQNLANLILGYHTEETPLTSERLKSISSTHRFILFTLHADSRSAFSHIQEWLTDSGFGDLAHFLSDSGSPQIGFLILFLPDTAAFGSHSLVCQITEALFMHARQFSLPLTVGISQVHSGLKELHDAFTETSDALNQQELSSPACCSYSYKPGISPKTFVWDREEEFLFRVEAGMTEEVRALIEELFSDFPAVPAFTLLDAKYYCYLLSNQCRGILNYYLTQETKETSRSVQNIVSHIFTLEELKNYYSQFFRNIAELLKADSLYALDDVIEKIKIYIQKNYQKNLTQDFIASLFYLNRSYLSTLFKQRTGMKFVDYLNEVRIEKSKELLKDSSKKMYQISRAVGYDNPKYFFRIFKKKNGVTPEQYRQMQQ